MANYITEKKILEFGEREYRSSTNCCDFCLKEDTTVRYCAPFFCIKACSKCVRTGQDPIVFPKDTFKEKCSRAGNAFLEGVDTIICGFGRLIQLIICSLPVGLLSFLMSLCIYLFCSGVGELPQPNGFADLFSFDCFRIPLGILWGFGGLILLAFSFDPYDSEFFFKTGGASDE